MKHIPNIFTLLNLFFGCLAIVFTLQNGIIITLDADGTQLLDMPEKIWMASLFIGIAAVVDFLDGFVARLFKATSEMGKQLDSLADVVSFGVAPGIIIYQFLRLSFAQDVTGVDVSLLWLLPAFVLPCAAAWRLARFNLDTSQLVSFKGMPVPAAGIFVASLPLIYWNVNEEWAQNLLLNKWFLYGLIIFLSYMMISKHRMISLKFTGFGVNDNEVKYLLILLSVISVLVFKWVSVPVIFCLYIILSFFSKYLTSTFNKFEGRYALSIGAIILIANVLIAIFAVKQDFSVSSTFKTVIAISSLFIRILLSLWVFMIAKKLKKNPNIWASIGFLFPSITLIIVGLKYLGSKRKA